MTKGFGPFKQAVIDLLTGEDPHAARTAGMADHLYLPTHVLFDPGAPGSCIGIVDPDLLHTRKLAFDWLQKQWDALSILELGAMHHHFQQQAQRIDQQVTLPSRELFAPIIAMRSASFGGFDRLAINNRCARCRLASVLHAQALPQRLHHSFPNAGVTPLAKVVIHRRPGRIVMGQQTPGSSTAQHIKDSIEDLPHIDASRSASWFGCWNQRLKNRPFGIRKITGIGFHRGRSSSLATSFLFMCFYCTTFPQAASSSPPGSPGLAVPRLSRCETRVAR